MQLNVIVSQLLLEIRINPNYSPLSSQKGVDFLKSLAICTHQICR